jgi:hypothetical protein
MTLRALLYENNWTVGLSYGALMAIMIAAIKIAHVRRGHG